MVSATPTRKRLAASASKARSIRKLRLAHGRPLPTSQNRPQAASRMIKFASTLSGGTAVGLAAALLTPSVIVTIGAMIAGLIGSGLLVKRFG